MTIYDRYDNVIIDVTVDDVSHRLRELCGEHYVRLQFSLAEYVDIPVGAYVIMDGERYTLLDPQNIKMEHTRYYEYVVILDAEQAKLKLYKFINPVDKRLNFTLTAKPHEHLKMLIDNLSTRDSAWTIGECIEGVEKTISYNYLSCWDALLLMANELDTEWEVVGNTISLHKVDYYAEAPLPLAYGEGFVSGVSRTNYGDTKPLSVVYAQGGERNIDASKYGRSTLLLPKNKSIRYDGVRFEDEIGFLDSKAVEYITNSEGTGVRRFIPNGNIAEGSLDCTDIYPQRVGKVTQVIEADADKNLYDIVDATIPALLNYDKCIIAGEKMVVVFQSGMLAGREFDAAYKHYAIGDKPSRRFEIVPREYDGETMPGGNFLPAAGDEYAVFGIALPEAYLSDDTTKTGASWDMFRKVVRHLADNERPQYTFSGILDKIWGKRHWADISGYMRPGAHIAFSNDAFQRASVNVRIESIKDYINAPHVPEIGLSDKVSKKPSYRLGDIIAKSKQDTFNLQAKKDSRKQSGDIISISSDRQLYINEHTFVASEREIIENEYKEFIVEYQILRDSQRDSLGREMRDKDGYIMRVRKATSVYDTYKQAYKSYAAALDNVISSKGLANITPEYKKAENSYYVARAELSKAIAVGTKKKIADLDYLKDAFGADNVMDSNGVVLSQLVSVKDADGDVVAGIYGGANENLNNGGFKDRTHGTLMQFAGASSAQDVANAKYRVYEDGTMFAESGVFGGLIKRSPKIITPSNYTSYSNISEMFVCGATKNKACIIDVVSAGSMLVFDGMRNDFAWSDIINAIEFDVYDPNQSTNVFPLPSGKATLEDMLQLVGSQIILYFKRGIFEGISLEDKMLNEGILGGSSCWKVEAGDILVATCIMQKQGGKKAIFWEYEKY